MYKSLFGAIGLFGLLLLLCTINPSTVAAESAGSVEERVIVVNTAQITATEPATVSTPMTEGALYIENLTVQNQLILEVLPSYSSSVTVALEQELFSTEILYQRANENVVILATKETDNIKQQITTIVNQNVFVVESDPGLGSKNVDSGDRPSVLIANQEVFLIGSPHGVGAMPFGFPLLQGTSPTNPLINQWALSHLSPAMIGVDLYRELGVTRATSATGKDVRIVIFDTSPFTFPVQNDGDGKYTGVFSVPFQIGNFPPLRLKVTNIQPTQPYTHDFPGEELHLSDQDISSHGLFVAALAYAMAPEAEIELVQVLDSHGIGTLDALLLALHNLITATQNSTMPTVLNLSLGVLRESSVKESDLQLLLNEISVTYAASITIVAAAGNHLTSTETLTMQIPANHPAVIGVGASNAYGQIACFSKRLKAVGPKAAAPGGDARVTDGCDPEKIMNQCVNQMLLGFLQAAYIKIVEQRDPEINHDFCPDMLTSLVREPQTSNYRYARWMGTSFATPLVSGWVALRLQNESQSAIYVDLTPITPKPDSCLILVGTQSEKIRAC